MKVMTEQELETDATPAKSPLWELRGVSKAFPGVQALDDVSMEIYPGEVHALLGENGCGKSTLAKCIAGVHQPERGEIYFRGEAVNFRHPMEARASGVATIYQEFSLVPTLTVAENIYLGRYPRFSGGIIDWTAVRNGTQEVLDQLSLKLDPDAVVRDLSVAEQQLVEIAKAISLESNLLIMDEPTAALGLVEIQHLMDLIRRLTQQDKAIVYISHRLDEVFRIADRVTILKDGKRVSSAPISTLKMGDVVRMMIGFDIQQHYPKERNTQPTPCLNVEDITTENGVKGVSFSVNVGEVFGLGGMLGSGRTEIARAIYGLDHILSGRIYLDGKEVRFNSPDQAVKAGVGLVPENRKSEGCFFNFEGPKNITISRLSKILRGPFLNLSAERRVGENYVERMNIHRNALERSVQFLSGGNQQKVILARELSREPDLILAAQPTRGLDVGATEFVERRMLEQRARGAAILYVSTELEEILSLSDRIAVLHRGEIMGIVRPGEVTEEALGLMMAGEKRGTYL